MKRLLVGVAIFLFVFQTLTLPVFSARFRDDMDRLDSSPAISYHNLALSPTLGVGNDSLFKISDPEQNSGAIVYRINNASKVSAVVYSALGSQLYTNQEKNFFLGDGFSHSALTPTGFATFFSPSDNGVYILPGGSPQKLVYRNDYGYYFNPVGIIPNDLTNYTLTMSISVNGKEYSSLSLLRASSENFEALGLIKEEWSAFIPAGVTYLKVEINDFTKIFVEQQGVYEPRSVENMAMVAHVDIEGDGLIIGVPQPIEVNTGSSSSSSSSKVEKESSKATSSKPTSSRKASSTPSSISASASPPSSSPKFEGIVSPEISPKKTSSLSVTAKFEGALSKPKVTTSESATKEAALPSQIIEESNNETFFFAAEDSATGESSFFFIVGYVILLTVGILIALKNRSGSGK